MCVRACSRAPTDDERARTAAYAASKAAVHQLTRRLESGLEEIGVEITSGAETCMVRYLSFFLHLRGVTWVTPIRRVYCQRRAD